MAEFGTHLSEKRERTEPTAAKDRDEGVRPWVKRLGSYLRIFGTPDSSAATKAWDGRNDLDRMADVAKEREAEHGR